MTQASEGKSTQALHGKWVQAPDGLLLIDKPAGITSHDVVDAVRRRFRIRRVGHGGTLDPAATGLLILLVGKATRQAKTWLSLEKSYRATLRLGVTTDTQDAEGRILQTRPVPPLTPAKLEEVLARFRGQIEQEVPIYSAIRIKGKHSYELARKGIAVPPKKRRVTIHELKLLALRLPEVELEATCSTGTYVRALCADLGEELGCGAHLKTLRRTQIGPFRLEQAVPLERATLEGLLPLASLGGVAKALFSIAPAPASSHYSTGSARPGPACSRYSAGFLGYGAGSMIVLRRIPSRSLSFRKPVAAIGIFDGVHRGHQAILKRAVFRARAIHGTPVVLTFDPHPLTVLAPGLVPPMLLSLDQRLAAFQEVGIRATLVIPFTRPFSRWSPEAFIRRIPVNGFRVREVVVGHDFGFGRGRSGTIETLKTLGKRFGFKVHVVGPIKILGKRVSSHRIRALIQGGQLKKAALALGRPATVVGEVVHGADRGRALGFPTANLRLEAGVLPPVGVYAVKARIVSQRGKVVLRLHGGMANLGFRPTFQKPERADSASGTDSASGQGSLFPLLEVHLFGVRRSLYGEHLEVSFLKRLRSQRRFPSAQALARQLARDAAEAQAYLKETT